MGENFINIQDYVVHIKGTSVIATNGHSSYGAEINGQLLQRYAAGQMENAHQEAQRDGPNLNLVFWQRDGGLRLNKATLELSPIEPIIPVHALTSLMCAALHRANEQIGSLENRVAQLETQLDDMVAAKSELQTDLLSRLHCVLNSRVNTAEPIIDS